MKKATFGGLVLALAVTGCNQANQSAEEDAVALETEQQRVSYSLGANLAARIGGDMQVDARAFAAGVNDVLMEKPIRMSDEQMTETLQAFQQKQMAERQAAQEAAAEANLAAATEFLAANAKKDGVKTTESGLQYRVLTAGEGDKPGAEDTVEVHYRGTLIDGTEFDSSYKRNSTVTFPVNGVIPGWTEALQMMPVGAKWELAIPPDLAYGRGGAGEVIPGNSALVFEVELVDIKTDADD